MSKTFINRNHLFYFALLLLAATWLAALHWIVNPYKLSVWIDAHDAGFISIESKCLDPATRAQNYIQPVVAGYFQYAFTLPKCQLDTIAIAGDSKSARDYGVPSAAISLYGKDIYRLSGNKRTLEGEGIYNRDSRPTRAAGTILANPLVLHPEGLNTADIRIKWPRYLPVILLPLIWWGTRKLAGRQSPHPDTLANSRYIAFLAVAAFALISAMAMMARTDVSVHPDELTHVASARYYYDHWLKPTIGTPDTIDAHKTNVYGVAYLTGPDPVYLLASKFAVAIWPVFENDVIALRMFNVALFGMLALWALRTRDLRLALIPLLATPQAWYIFSYFNGEGLPLFLSTLVVVLTFGLTRSARPEDSPIPLKRIFVLGCLTGAILLSKPNYWTVLGMVALLLIAQENYLSKGKFSLMVLGWLFTLFGAFLILDHQIALPTIVSMLPIGVGIGLLLWTCIILVQRVMKKYKTGLFRMTPIVVLLAGLITVLGLQGVNEAWHNPLPFTAARSEALNKVLETNALPGFKPGTLDTGGLSKDHRMHDQGIGLSEMLVERTWLKTSITSFLGVYGYMNIWPTKYFSYALLFMFTMVAISVLVLARRRQGGSVDYALPISVFVGVVTAIAASIGFSWIVDYQAQGKYLLPILPILAAGLVIAGQKASSNQPLRGLVIGAFVLSATSFLLVAIRWIPKQPGIY